MRSSVLSVTLVAGLASASSSPSPTTGDKNAAAAASASAAKAQAAAKASIAAEIQAIAIYQAKAEAAHIQQILESMPKCATACLKNSTAHVGCNMTDIECQCGKLRPLVVDIAPCMIKLGCDMQQMISRFILVSCLRVVKNQMLTTSHSCWLDTVYALSRCVQQDAQQLPPAAAAVDGRAGQPDEHEDERFFPRVRRRLGGRCGGAGAGRHVCLSEVWRD